MATSWFAALRGGTRWSGELIISSSRDGYSSWPPPGPGSNPGVAIGRLAFIIGGVDMARYLEKAERYSKIPVELLEMVSEENRPKAADLIARLVNAGIVCCPRGVQGTVRINIVKEVCKHIPIRCNLEERMIDPENPERGTYKALVTQAK